MSSDAKAARIATGIRIIKDLQTQYTPICPNENLPYHAAALIVSGGPYGQVIPQLNDLLTSLQYALAVVHDIKEVIEAQDAEATA